VSGNQVYSLPKSPSDHVSRKLVQSHAVDGPKKKGMVSDQALAALPFRRLDAARTGIQGCHDSFDGRFRIADLKSALIPRRCIAKGSIFVNPSQDVLYLYHSSPLPKNYGGVHKGKTPLRLHRLQSMQALLRPARIRRVLLPPSRTVSASIFEMIFSLDRISFIF
jgi:hypothetical protein